MKALTTIKKKTADTFAIYNSESDLIATAEFKEDGRYLIAICGGIAHGKIAYAADFQDLNDKSVEIASLPR